jgi:hypothetical protein
MYDELKNSNPGYVEGGRILHIQRTPIKKRNNNRKKKVRSRSKETI